MFISISADGDLDLKDVDNMKTFSIVEAAGASEEGKAGSALANIAEAAEDDHYWIDAEAVIQLSARSEDPQWVENFWAMLKKVEAYGYSDLKAKCVKAHVQTS